jgi:hypothetical protein
MAVGWRLSLSRTSTLADSKRASLSVFCLKGEEVWKEKERRKKERKKKKRKKAEGYAKQKKE